jgi:hypothetical protein
MRNVAVIYTEATQIESVKAMVKAIVEEIV